MTQANDAEDALLHLVRAVRDTGYEFTTVTPATHARVNARPGGTWARDLRDVFGWSRRFHASVVPRSIFELMHSAGVIAPAGDGWRATVRISTLRGTAFLHSAYPTEQADAVFFGPDTYRFADAICAWFDHGAPVGRAMDIGCGSGAGGIVVARARPRAEVLMGDINDRALRLAHINAMLAGVHARVAHSDLLSGVSGQFDLIVANPPYLLDPSRRAYRHGGGTMGEGLSLDIVGSAVDRLNPGGTLLLYTGVAITGGRDAFLTSVADRLGSTRWSYRELDPDVFGEELAGDVYADADRIAAVLLTATKRGKTNA